MTVIRATKRVARRLLGRHVRSQRPFRRAVENRAGLEIGGPSSVFGDDGILPLYRHLQRLDNCVYAAETIWEGRRAVGQTFCFHPGKPKGFNFICEASNLHLIEDHVYDFILLSHSLEHTANPLKVLKELMRVAKPGAAIIFVLPHYRYTFDHRRRPTPLTHMLEDYERGIDEDDRTHLQEILELHDLSRDLSAGSPEQFRDRSMRNIENRCLHHHIFDEHNSRELIETAGLKVATLEFVKPFQIFILAYSSPARSSSRTEIATS
jgi:SAM-dependent methyltransferase